MVYYPTIPYVSITISIAVAIAITTITVTVKVPTTPATTRVITVLLIVKNTSLVCFDSSVHITPSLKCRNIQYCIKCLQNTRMLSYCCSIHYHRYRLHKTMFIYFIPVITEKKLSSTDFGHVASYLEMGQNRYRVPEVSVIGSFSNYRYRQKIRFRYRVIFDIISILFRYFTSVYIITMSCNEIQRERNTLDLMSPC